MGIVNLFSAVLPGLPDRLRLLSGIIPFDVEDSGRLFAALSGFSLLMLAANLLRRKRIAWILTIVMLFASIVSHLAKGWDYEECILAAILLVQLLFMRKVFTAPSDRPSIGQGLRFLLGSLLFTLAYGTLGFYLQDQAYNLDFDLPSALGQTLAMFFTGDDGGLVPRTKFGRFFGNSIYLVGGSTMIVALWMLLRPVLLRGRPTTSAEYLLVTQIVEAHGNSSLTRFALLADKSFYFSPSGQTVIAYVPKGRGAIALGDPIGPIEDRQAAIHGFKEFCLRRDWAPAFYQTRPNELETYYALGFGSLQIGEEGLVDLVNFSLTGKAKQDLRTSLNKSKRLGYQANFYEPPISTELLNQLRSVSNEWLQATKGAEKRFSLGWFHADYLRDCKIVTVTDETGQIIAFANVVNGYQSKDVTVDLMRQRVKVPPGTMDFLFVSMFEKYKAQGYQGFSIGLSALSGVGEVPESRRLEQGLRYLSKHLNRFYNFKGIHNYKKKFQPQWEPRYLVYLNVVELPMIVVSLIRADSGDQLLDYLRPGG